MTLFREKAQEKDDSSTQKQRSDANVSKKPRRVESVAAKKSPSSPTHDLNDKRYDIEDSDDENGDGDDAQCSTNEIMERLNEAQSEHNMPKPKSKSSSFTKRSSLLSGGQTITKFFNKSAPKTPNGKSATETETQEKRSRSSLLSALDTDYNDSSRKSVKTKCETSVASIQDQKWNNESIESPATSPSGKHEQESAYEPNDTQKNEDIEMDEATDRKTASDSVSTPKDQNNLDENGVENESKKDNGESDDSFAELFPDTTNTAETLFDELKSRDEDMEIEGTDESPHDNSNMVQRSSTPSKVNVRPRGQHKYRLTNESSSLSSSTVFSQPSSQNMHSEYESQLNSSIDQTNSDLNTESDQLKALNVAADEKCADK